MQEKIRKTFEFAFSEIQSFLRKSHFILHFILFAGIFPFSLEKKTIAFAADQKREQVAPTGKTYLFLVHSQIVSVKAWEVPENF